MNSMKNFPDNFSLTFRVCAAHYSMHYFMNLLMNDGAVKNSLEEMKRVSLRHSDKKLTERGWKMVINKIMHNV